MKKALDHIQRFFPSVYPKRACAW